MKKIFDLLIATICIISSGDTNAQDKYLQECWNKQVKIPNGQHLKLSFQEKLNELEHSFEPWQQSNYTGKGIIWSNGDGFSKQDTLTNGRKIYFSKTVFNNTEMLFVDFGDKELFPVTQDMFLNQTYKSAKYSPINVISYFFKKKIKSDPESNAEFAVYKTTINKTIVKLFIRKSDNIAQKITTLSNDELFGDVLTSYSYNDYATIEKLFYPKTIQIEKINGKVKDEVVITKANFVSEVPKLLDKPSDYKIKEVLEIKPEIIVSKYNNNIHFLELKHTDDRVMIAEFQDFLLVAEAPLNSENGDLIIKEAKKIAPYKPIKYFVFGHYHPHYIGGLRPFVAEGAKIICSKINEDYVKYLTNAQHTLNPDNLHNAPKPLQIEEIKENLVIADGKTEMKIYFIGDKSEHTKDYLIYYFPQEKLLFEDDLVWIPNNGEIKKASKRQLGLYKAIKELNLDVKTIVQSWPVINSNVKTIIPFEDLERSTLVN